MELQHQLRELLVAFFGSVGEPERTCHALAQKPELHPELSDSFLGKELFLPVSHERAAAVQIPEDLGDVGEYVGANGGVVDFERPHHLGQKIQAVGELFERPPVGFGVRYLGEVGRLELGHSRSVGGECSFTEEKLHRALAVGVEIFDDSLLERLDTGQIDVARFPECYEVSSGRPQLTQAIDVLIDGGPGIRSDLAKDGRDRFLGGREGLPRLGPKGFDFLELVDDRLGGGVHVTHRREEVCDLLVLEPVVAVGGPRASRHQVLIFLASRLLLVDHATDAQEIRDPADEVGVSNVLQDEPVGGLVLTCSSLRKGVRQTCIV